MWIPGTHVFIEFATITANISRLRVSHSSLTTHSLADQSTCALVLMLLSLIKSTLNLRALCNLHNGKILGSSGHCFQTVSICTPPALTLDMPDPPYLLVLSLVSSLQLLCLTWAIYLHSLMSPLITPVFQKRDPNETPTILPNYRPINDQYCCLWSHSQVVCQHLKSQNRRHHSRSSAPLTISDCFQAKTLNTASASFLATCHWVRLEAKRLYCCPRFSSCIWYYTSLWVAATTHEPWHPW